MSDDYYTITRLCNGGWVIVSITDDGDGEYTVEMENEGDVNQYKDFPDEHGKFSVSKEEAESFSSTYGVTITRLCVQE